MNRRIRIGLYAILLLLALVFGQRFYTEYTKLMRDPGDASSDLTASTPTDRKIATGDSHLSYLILFGAGLFVSVVAAGLMAAHDLSHFVANRALKFIYDEDVQIEKDPDYEEAEKEWANGNHLEAIRLMREYVQRKPREVHALIRIAEIYEQDLHNPLAAALEYEEVLTHKLRPERWGWAAIHLCNLYYKLNQADKAVTLLQRIDAECGDTPPAEKARKRLALLAGEPEPEPEPPTT